MSIKIIEDERFHCGHVSFHNQTKFKTFFNIISNQDKKKSLRWLHVNFVHASQNSGVFSDEECESFYFWAKWYTRPMRYYCPSLPIDNLINEGLFRRYPPPPPHVAAYEKWVKYATSCLFFLKLYFFHRMHNYVFWKSVILSHL